jgi:alanine racemase
VVSDWLPEYDTMKDANFLVVKDTLKALQKLAVFIESVFPFR